MVSLVTTQCYNINMYCILCHEPLGNLPLYNSGEDNLFPPSVPFCNNIMCPRFGLLTITTSEKSVEDVAKEDKKADGKKEDKKKS